MSNLQSNLIFTLRDNVTGPMNRLTGSLARFQTRNRQILSGMIPGGNLRGLIGMYAGYRTLTAGIRGTVGAAISFESAMADVRKVVDTTPAGFRALTKSVIDMSKRLPMTAEGLAEIMAAAGQAGMVDRELTSFTELAAKAGIAFDMTAGSVGEALAKIKTQLKLTVPQTEELADVINYLSNTSASAAPDLIDYMKRIAAQGEVFGFTAKETLAIGSAMIAAGGESEVAATSFRNVGRALSRGAGAAKKQKAAFRLLRLDAVKVQKDFNKDSVGTLLHVLELIAKLPKELQASTMSDMFGDEARAMTPLLSNIELLRDSLRRANDEAAKGSVTKEFEARAATTDAAIQRLRNNIRAIGIELGSRWLPAIAGFAGRLSSDLQSLGTTTDDVFTRMGRAWAGFKEGLGLGDVDIFGRLKAQFSDLERFIFGTPLTGLSATEQALAKAANAGALDRLSGVFRQLGAAIRELVSGDIIGGLQKLVGFVKSLFDSFGSLGAVGLAIGASATLAVLTNGLRLLIGVAAGAAFGTSVGRMITLMVAIRQLAEIAQKSDSIGSFFQNLAGQSWGDLALTIGGTAIAIGLLVKSIRGLTGAVRAARGVGVGIGGLFKGKGAVAAEGGAVARTGRIGRGGAVLGIAAAIGAGIVAFLASRKRAEAAEAPRAPRVPPLHAPPEKGGVWRGVDWITQANTPRYPGTSIPRFRDQQDGEGKIPYLLKSYGRSMLTGLWESLIMVGPGKLGTAVWLTDLAASIRELLPKELPRPAPEVDRALRRDDPALQRLDAIRAGQDKGSAPSPDPAPASRFDGAFDQFRSDAGAATSEVNSKLAEVAAQANIQGSVQIDAASLDAALAKAQRLLGTLQQVGTAAASASASVGRLADNVSRSISDRVSGSVRAAHGDVV